MGKNNSKEDIALKNYTEGYNIIKQHPMFSPLLYHVYPVRRPGSICPDSGWAVITQDGNLYIHPTRRGEPLEWAYVIAHCLLHLGLGHFRIKEDEIKWNIACDCFITKFLADLKLGKPPKEFTHAIELHATSEEKLYEGFIENDVPAPLTGFGTAGQNNRDMVKESKNSWRKLNWVEIFSTGISMAVTSAINVAAGYEPFLGSEKPCITSALRAKNWFINSYPLLGALASCFSIIEDPIICARMNISIAAVSESTQEIYVNPAAGLDEHECKFVIAHELLHVGLCHHTRCQGRDHYIWNVACDYIINNWIVEMGIGELPKMGALYDEEFKGLSAESVYDRIVTDLRKYRKLATLRGTGLGDIIGPSDYTGRTLGDGISIDDFYRDALNQGLVYHHEQSRGLLPAGLIEEIRALSQPPVPWDVELAKWFDNYFTPLENVHSYARLSRRQPSTPDIPRAAWIPREGSEEGRTYGVIIDTSGSMERSLLAKALGTIASYSISRDVPLVRIIFCDAMAYDEGYISPETIADRVKIKGRGGTILQPGIDLLENAKDFPKNGPILIITDGECEPLKIHRDHAFLIPKGKNLPFIPKGKVFRFS